MRAASLGQIDGQVLAAGIRRANFTRSAWMKNGFQAGDDRAVFFAVFQLRHGLGRGAILGVEAVGAADEMLEHGAQGDEKGPVLSFCQQVRLPQFAQARLEFDLRGRQRGGRGNGLLLVRASAADGQSRQQARSSSAAAKGSRWQRIAA